MFKPIIGYQPTRQTGRDRSDAAALGRPMRIHDDDCDLEMLEESDFEDEEDTDSTITIVPSSKIHRLYCIEVAKLSVLCTSITLLPPQTFHIWTLKRGC